MYSSHDSTIHIARLAQSFTALKEGHFPLRWLSNWHFGFGYPVFIFTYSLPYYVGALFKIFGFSFETIFKILIFLSLFFSGIGFFYFAKKYFKDFEALIGSLFFIAAPYRFADIYERGALGEALSFIFIPLLFITPHSLIKNKLRGFIFTSLVIFAFITTHALTFLVFFPVILIYPLFVFGKKLKDYLYFFSAIAFGFLLSSYQWIPLIFEQKYADLDNTYFNIYRGHFITIYQLLRIPKEGINIGTGIQLGTAQIVVVCLIIFLIFYDFLKRRKVDRLVVFFLITSFITAFLTLDLSKTIWNNFGPLQKLVFPWRFLTLTIFITSFFAAYLVNFFHKVKYRKLLIVLLIFLAFFPSRHYLKGYFWHSFTDDYYNNYPDEYRIDSYFLPRGLIKNFDKLQLKNVSVIEGKGEVELLKKQNNLLEVMANLSQESKIQFHTFYFPGWELKVSGKKWPIITNQHNLEGIIVSSLPAGNHQLSLKFTETPLRLISDLLSLGSFILLFLILIFKFLKRLKPQL